jgi:hypothetical protein
MTKVMAEAITANSLSTPARLLVSKKNGLTHANNTNVMAAIRCV